MILILNSVRVWIRNGNNVLTWRLFLRSPKFSKKISWLEPYFGIAYSMYPDILRNLKKVYRVPTPLDKRMTYFGLCITYTDDTYAIGVATHYQHIVFRETHVDVKKAPFSSLDILDSFAHEIAHMITGDNHTVYHKRVEQRIMGKFLTRLNKSGYISEEEELKKKGKRNG